MGKGFFWQGERARAPAGVGAELYGFSRKSVRISV